MSKKTACLCRMREFMRPYLLKEEQLRIVYDRFCKQLLKGLTREGNEEADLKNYMTYVQDLPLGSEVGEYLALDLGGTNFRVLYVRLKGNRDAEMVAKIYVLSDEVTNGPGVRLFDYIAKCLLEFVAENELKSEQMPLGFTFSFACTQVGLSKALLVRFAKGFRITGIDNMDVGQLLMEAVERQGGAGKIDLAAIINDTTGTLMACAHKNPNCRIGLIIGTGTNACYVERTENCELLPAEFKRKPYMVINTEWGAFGEHGDLDFIRTDEDDYIQETTPNKGDHMEKMSSGMYLGMLVRMILEKALREGLIFSEMCPVTPIADVLYGNPKCFKTRHVSEVEGDEGPPYPATRRVLKEVFNIEEASVGDVEKLRLICEAVSKRSAYLVGVGLSGLINQINFKKVVVGVDGTVYRLHPRYEGYMRRVMELLVNKNIKYDLMLSVDGSGSGAALVAAAKQHSLF